jgi:hypothetical protein
MGLDTTHDAWHGPYSMFMRWRVWLAAQIGVPLWLMTGFCKWQYDEKDLATLSWDDPKRDAIQSLVDVKGPLPWSIMNGDPIVALLSHSDCDGKIPWWTCKALALRLTQIYRETAGSDVQGHGGMERRRGCYDSMRRATIRFALGCKRAWDAREHLEFH